MTAAIIMATASSHIMRRSTVCFTPFLYHFHSNG
jgi:hypothetical protein